MGLASRFLSHIMDPAVLAAGLSCGRPAAPLPDLHLRPFCLGWNFWVISISYPCLLTPAC